MALAPKTVYTYPLDGSNRTFAINFEYLTRKFVQITLIGQDRKLLVLNQDYRFVTRTSIQTTIAWGPAQGYETIEIRRFTSATDRLVDFSDGSILRAYDLNISSVQALHIAEEARDLSADTIAVNNDGDLDARGRRIVNLADATDPSHAVTLRQEQEWAASTLSNRNAAESSANASAQSASGSSAARDRAIQAENKAKEWAVAPTEIDGDQYSSRSWALASGRFADDAKASAKVATDEIAKIDGQVDLAKGHADRSKTEADRSTERAASSAASANSANNSAISASGDATRAKNSAKDASEAGLQMGMSMWGYRPQPFNGFVVDDGQELDQATYPAFVQALRDGLFPTTDEATWQANPWARGYFVLNSSPGKFRMRDLNGAQPGSYGGVFQRGDNGNVTQPGNRQWRPHIFRDQIQDHRHPQSERYYGDGADGKNGGVETTVSSGTGQVHGNQAIQTYDIVKTTGMPVDAKFKDGARNPYNELNPVRHGAETYPVHVTGAWMTRLFGLITPLGSAEANSLATAYGALSSRTSALEGRMRTLGDGQTWKDMTSQRTWNTVYTNDTGRSIQVIVRLNQQSTSLSYFYVNDFLIGYFGQANIEGGGQCSAIVPPGSVYRLIDGRGRNTLNGWYELRT
ncbi:tail fiber protein [Pseudomonas phage PspYZU08]|uniref:Tail fiber protein n=1 Tax=Pseudomonas phage PspYZU08 TaxID=1983557 RepID=A0A2U7NC16_9CAUD|nr:tail fiber protein [Pseudomonas phage PspYZU08]ASD52219.1 tail fiber protein [Pseudomonas phage PspYZU08]